MSEQIPTPFKVAVLGDFTGRGGGREPTPRRLGDRRFQAIDRDNFDDVLRKLDVRLRISIGDAPQLPIDLVFTEMDDFHPDRLYSHIGLFDELRALRQRLLDPATYRAAAAELQEGGQEKPVDVPAEQSREAPPPSGELLSSALEETARQADDRTESRGEAFVGALVKRIVAPYVVPAPDPDQAALLASVDAAVSQQMALVLHHPEFQDLESRWRGLHLLVHRLETDRDLKIAVLDVSKEELGETLDAAGALESTALYKLLVEQARHVPGAQPWGLVVGDFTFDASGEDAELLGRVGKIAAAAGAPFVTGAHPHLVHSESLAESADPDDWRREVEPDAAAAWEALRALPEARYLGLGLPRFVLRLPYGARTSPVEAFEFEEVDGEPNHAHYLWANPAWAMACLVAQAFTEAGWALRPGQVNELDGLPVHVYRADGESHTQPCAEVELSERGAEAIWAHGITALWSVRGTDRIRVGPFRSLSLSSTSLHGGWADDQGA